MFPLMSITYFQIMHLEIHCMHVLNPLLYYYSKLHTETIPAIISRQKWQQNATFFAVAVMSNTTSMFLCVSEYQPVIGHYCTIQMSNKA